MNKLNYYLFALLVLFSCQYQHFENIQPGKVLVVCDTSTTAGYAQDIAPIVNKYCISCHNIKDADALGDGTVLDNYDDMLNNANASMRDITGVHYKMPKDGPKVDTCDILKIKVWIDSGFNP